MHRDEGASFFRQIACDHTPGTGGRFSQGALSSNSNPNQTRPIDWAGQEKRGVSKLRGQRAPVGSRVLSPQSSLPDLRFRPGQTEGVPFTDQAADECVGSTG